MYVASWHKVFNDLWLNMEAFFACVLIISKQIVKKKKFQEKSSQTYD